MFALRPKYQKTKSTTYWVAVLKSIAQPATSVYGEEDFLWIKCHGSISVKTIYEQYTAKHPEVGDVKLKLGSKFPSETTPIRDLDEFNDRLVVFEPLKDSDQSARASVERVPLQPIQHQVTVKPDSEELSSKIPANIPKYQGLNPAPQDENIKPAVGHVAAPPISPHRPLPAVVAQLPPYNPTPHQPGGYQPPLCKTPYLEPSPLSRLHHAQQQHIQLTQAQWRRQILLNTLRRLPQSGRYLRDSISSPIDIKKSIDYAMLLSMQVSYAQENSQ